MPVAHRPHIDFAQPRRNCAHARIGPFGQAFLGFRQTLIDLGAGEVNIHVIMENCRDLAESVARDGAGALQARNTSQRRLDRESHLLFDFHRREGGRGGVDLDLHIGNVGDGVNRQVLKRIKPKARHGGCEQRHQVAVMKRELQDALDHGG
jgi:hypothetical protein